MSEYIINIDIDKARFSEDGTKIQLVPSVLWEIVRCRDCEHYDPYCTDDGVCFLPDGDGDFARWEVKPDGFCAWGERRTND